MKIRRNEEDKKKRKEQEDWLTAYVLEVMEKSAEKALEEAIDKLFKDWK